MLRDHVRPFSLLAAALALVAVSSCKNRPPEVPPAPTGPVDCFTNKNYMYLVVATDPNGDQVAARVDWGDSTISEWSDLSASGDTIRVTHIWSDTGTYAVIAQAKDRKEASSEWSAPLSVQVQPRPDAPSAPVGPDTCFRDTIYTFKTAAIDRYGDSVAIRFDWDNGDTSAWSTYVASGETVAMNRAWADLGTRNVKAQARDPKLRDSEWSDAHPVRVVLRRAPNTPLAPNGPSRGEQDVTYEFSASASHPEGFLVAVRFDWGDGDTSDWGQFMAPGEPTTMGHAWSVPDTYGVRAQAKDSGNAVSAWSIPRSIAIQPKDTMRLWRYRVRSVAGGIASSPAIGPDSTIYVGAGDTLYAIDHDGTPKWRYATGGIVRSSPAVSADGSTVYVGSYDNHLYAINTAGGSLRWKYQAGDNVLSSPAIAADGTIYFGSDDDRIYALNPDGGLQWTYLTARNVYSSPAVAADGTILIGSFDDSLYAMTPGGVRSWTYKTGGDIEASPAIAADGTIYVGADDGYLYALNPDGSFKWNVLTNGNVSSSPAVAPDGTVYVGSWDKCLYAVSPAGTVKWLYPTGDKVYSSPAIGADGTVFFGSFDNYLYALNPDGSLKWRYETDNDIESSPTIGPDGTIYFICYDGFLYAIKGGGGLSASAWPKFRHDVKNTGRVGGGR